MKISLAGKFCYRYFPYRRKVIEDNIDLVFKHTISSEEKKTLIKAYYSHFFTTIKEIFQLGLGLKKFKQKPIFIGEEHLKKAFDRDKGVLILGGHLGNFQLASCLSARYFSHLGKFNVILKPISIKWIENIFYAGFDKNDVDKIISVKGWKKILSKLKQKEAIFFAFDQHASIVKGHGIAVDFFGKKAATYTSLAVVTKLTQAAVIPAYTYRDEHGKHHILCLPPIEWIGHEDKDTEIYLNTLNYNQVLEKMILACPAQWIWSHRRWKI